MTPPTGTNTVLGQDYINVKINGIEYRVPETFSEVSLTDYLRVHLHLTGTKVMCREGGCGVCIVSVVHPDPDPSKAGQVVQRSINSCLCPILSCDGWEITTIEGLGNQSQLHPFQTTLSDNAGSQCGYCSSGMIMTMYSLSQNQPNLTQQIVEDSFDGNICRCTGYRPILQAFKSVVGSEVADIEDGKRRFCKTTGKKCNSACTIDRKRGAVQQLPEEIAVIAPPWFKPTTLAEVYSLIDIWKNRRPYYVVGHTGKGVYDDGPYGAYIDLKGVSVLYAIEATDTSLIVGANVALTDLIAVLEERAKRNQFGHLNVLAKLLKKTAHVSVRNFGCWAGNLALKHRHRLFPSDTAVGFTMVEARIFVGTRAGETSNTIPDFLDLDLSGKLILRAEFKPFGSDYVFQEYKIRPRAQQALPYVNAAFRARINRTYPEKFIISETPVLAFGGINATLIRAVKTESYLNGKDLGDIKVFQSAIGILKDEIQPAVELTLGTPEYRKSLCLSILYKFALEIVGDGASVRYRSAVVDIIRPISSGQQSYSTVQENWPLTQPITKLESIVQVTGEAKYIGDIDHDGLLHAAFTYAAKGNATFLRIESADALAVPGVVEVLTSIDIPGINDIRAPSGPDRSEEAEELLAVRQTRYAGQPIAIVVAVTREVAEAAAKLVKIVYSSVRPVITTPKDAAAKQSIFIKLNDVVVGNAEQEIAAALVKISGELILGAQHHFHMETQVAVAYPTEDGLNVEPGTQWLDCAQLGIAQVTGLAKNAITLAVKRLGGGFGGKISRANFVSAGAGLAAFILKKPVKMHMNLADNLRMLGKRFAYYATYQAGADSDGKLRGIILDIYMDGGGVRIRGVLDPMMAYLDNAYKCPAWRVSRTSCLTNTPLNTSCRAPGSAEAIYLIESIMEHLAFAVGRPSIEIKAANFYQQGDILLDGSQLRDFTLPSVLNQLLGSAEYASRTTAVQAFNTANRWRKRGIAVCPMRFPCRYPRRKFNCYIAIFHNGGSVAVSHGGIEMGQGINTKVAQVVAFELKIPLSLIKVLSTTAFTNANAVTTGASVTSELCALAAIDCCRQLNQRLQPVKELFPTAEWVDLIELCHNRQIDLSAHGWAAPPDVRDAIYNTYAAMCTEVELDVLTGEFQINRMDVLYDCGESMSPLIDVGQVEGAILMGLGYYTTEEVIYDTKTAENLTFGTWTYKVPTTKDIPIDFRIELLKNAPAPTGVLRSKFVAEPPLCMTASVIYALRNAIISSRTESGKGNIWFDIEAPLTRARIQQYCEIDEKELKFVE